MGVSLNTDLPQGACSQTDLSNHPQRHHDNRRECHDPAQCICPVRVNVPVVNLELFVIHHIQDKGSLGSVEKYLLSFLKCLQYYVNDKNLKSLSV